MKRKSIIAQKNKLKTNENLRYLNFARYACVILVVLFLAFVFISAQSLQTSFQNLITQSPLYLAGFTICLMNLYIWYVLKKLTADIKEYKNIESLRLNLIIMCVFQFLLLNFISAVSMVISLKQYFHWNNFKIKKAFVEVKKEKQFIPFMATFIFLILVNIMVYGIMFSMQII